MNTLCKTIGSVLFAALFIINANIAVSANTGCLSCHNGIESIREDSSGMMQLIKALSNQHGDPAGCVLCHGGDPTATEADKAHEGSPQSLVDFKGPQTFYPDPGAMDINKFTCGQSACHAGYEERVEKSLMNTEAGKIQALGRAALYGRPPARAPRRCSDEKKGYKGGRP